MGAVQAAVVPPLLPLQLQDHGPLPLTVVAVPALQRFVDGALVTVTPLAAPHVPLTGPVPPGEEEVVTTNIFEATLKFFAHFSALIVNEYVVEGLSFLSV